MEMTAATIAICVAVGLATGVISALCGVGGGIIMVPAFVTLLGMSQKHAVATSLAAIILTAIASSTRNWGNNLVDGRVSLATGVAAAVVAWFAAGWLKSMSNVTLTRIFAILVLIMGMHMLWSTRSAKPVAPPAPPSPPLQG